MKKLTTAQWVKKAKAIYNDTYDYSKVHYTTKRNQVIITCKIHGDFLQLPGNHLYSGGCKQCGNNATSIKTRSSTIEFITKAIAIHGNYYNYDNVVYTTALDKVVINCPIHGKFKQRPAEHLSSRGCRNCCKRGFQTSKPGVLYYLEINGGEAYKIGITNYSVKERFKTDMKYIRILRLYTFISGEDCLATEQEILKRFKQHKYIGPDLLKSGNSELFNCNILNL